MIFLTKCDHRGTGWEYHGKEPIVFEYAENDPDGDLIYQGRCDTCKHLFELKVQP